MSLDLCEYLYLSQTYSIRDSSNMLFSRFLPLSGKANNFLAPEKEKRKMKNGNIAQAY
jgi:hypothetical protein